MMQLWDHLELCLCLPDKIQRICELLIVPSFYKVKHTFCPCCWASTAPWVHLLWQRSWPMRALRINQSIFLSCINLTKCSGVPPHEIFMLFLKHLHEDYSDTSTYVDLERLNSSSIWIFYVGKSSSTTA